MLEKGVTIAVSIRTPVNTHTHTNERMHMHKHTHTHIYLCTHLGTVTHTHTARTPAGLTIEEIASLQVNGSVIFIIEKGCNYRPLFNHFKPFIN